MPDLAARMWFGATAGARWAAGLFNVFRYFTIQSNVLVGVGCLLVCLQVGRESTGVAALRLGGLAGITITGLVYHAAIAHLVEFDGWDLVADQLTHTVVPVMAVAGWLLHGPRGLAGGRTVFPYGISAGYRALDLRLPQAGSGEPA